jgi:molecular chaperone IbpA
VKFPPYNIIKINETVYHVDVALAGYQQENIEVIEDRNKRRLYIKGGPGVSETVELDYLHQGIAARKFNLEFFLGDNYNVKSASFVNGKLTVLVEQEIPDEMRPRNIEISG